MSSSLSSCNIAVSTFVEVVFAQLLHEHNSVQETALARHVHWFVEHAVFLHPQCRYLKSSGGAAGCVIHRTDKLSSPLNSQP